jgi:Fur family ferric uptake transcriptional regulator
MANIRYKTNQRKLILDFIIENKGRHVTADDVLFALRRKGYAIGKATIYRYFDCLVEEGTLRRYSPIDGASACYEYAGDPEECGSHYHMKCELCGCLFHTECNFLDEISAHMSEHHGFKLDKSKTVFYGICHECSKKNDGEKSHE